MPRQQRRIGEILLSKGLITEAQLQKALQEHTTTGEFLGIILIRQNAISPSDLTGALAEQFGFSVVRLKGIYIDWQLAGRFSSSLILDHKCFPLAQETWSVTMAVLNPLDAWAIKRAEEEAFPLRLNVVLTYPEDMEEVLKRYREHLKGMISGL